MKWTEEMSVTLRELMQDSRFEAVNALLDALIERASNACETAAQDQRYFQGMVFAYRDLIRKMEAASKKTEDKKPEHSPVEHFTQYRKGNETTGY